MSKKRSSRNTKSVKRSLERKRVRAAEGDYVTERHYSPTPWGSPDAPIYDGLGPPVPAPELVTQADRDLLAEQAKAAAEQAKKDEDERLRLKAIADAEAKKIADAEAQALLDVNKEGAPRTLQPKMPPGRVPEIEAAKAGKIPTVIPEGFSTTPPGGDGVYTAVPPKEGMIYVYGPNGERIEIPEGGGDDPSFQTQEKGELGKRIEQLDDYKDISPPPGVSPEIMAVATGKLQKAFADGRIPPAGYPAALARELIALEPAIGDKPEAAIVDEIRELTEQARAAKRDPVQEEAARMEAAKRPEAKDYATGATTDERFTVTEPDDPDAHTRTGQTIGPEELARLREIAKGRGVPIEGLPEYKKAAARVAQTGIEAQKEYVPRLGEAPSETEARAKTYGADYTPQGGTTEIDAIPAYAKAAAREAQVGPAAQRIATELGSAPSADLEGREAITGTAPQGDAAQIGGIPTFEAASRNAVTGEDRIVAAADMLAVVADIPEDVTAAISEYPATVQAQIDEGADPQVTAAVAALPQEALVSVQMENLLAGMEEGNTPAWARPAVAAIEQQMAQRGLSVSTVGRDALFNAIIQSALPMAQSNAQALQQRAQQNLSNEQQANLASAQNTMTVRMQNLANRQTAASQTASMAQEIKVQQGSFSQQATITTAQQKQQSEIATFQASQQKAQQESAQRQQAAIAELSTNAQMDLANLKAMNAAGADTMNAEQQGRLTKYKAQIAKVMRQADLNQDMEKANLPPALQVEMQRVSEMNAASKDTMTAENQERLVELQTLIDFRKTDAQFAQQMDMANMSNEQQMELAMLQDRSATDSANFTADNQFRMQELNQKVARSVRQAELDQRMEEVNLDSKLRVELSELSERNTTSRANMTADQQMRLANLNVLVDFRKTNAAMAQNMDMANLGNEQQMELAELSERAATDAANFTEDNRFRMQDLNTEVQVMSQNQALLQQADLANLSMEEKVSLANLHSKNQADSESMSAENVVELQVYEKKMQAGQVNAQLAQQMGLANLSNEQAAAMFNAQIDANMDIKQFDANQQAQLADSQFMQSMTVTDFNARQTAAMQNATAMANLDLSAVDQRTKLSITNANNFLQMDMANLSNEQQGKVIDIQLAQQRLLSNQSSENASRQFNATSENQINQFNTTMANQMEQFNAQQGNAMQQFNAAEENRMAAIAAGNSLDANKFNNQLVTQVSQFNEQMDLGRDQWNASNAQAIEQSNTKWRRNANLINTAAQNSVNQQNAQMAFNMSASEQSFLWQQLRDEANYVKQKYENDQQRKTSLYATALSNDSIASKDSKTSFNAVAKIIENVFKGTSSIGEGSTE